MRDKRKAYPHWSFTSPRAFKAKKRADMRRLIKALGEYRSGCAFCPDGARSREVNEIERILGHAREALSVRVWGR